MIVRDDDSGCACHDGQLKDLPGMAEDRIHCPDEHQVVAFDAPPCVEDEHHQAFTLRIEVGM